MQSGGTEAKSQQDDEPTLPIGSIFKPVNLRAKRLARQKKDHAQTFIQLPCSDNDNATEASAGVKRKKMENHVVDVHDMDEVREPDNKRLRLMTVECNAIIAC